MVSKFLKPLFNIVSKKQIANIFAKLVQPAQTHRWMFFIIVKGVGLVYFIAFISLLSQVKGLYLSDGILPIASYISRFESISWFQWPHIFLSTQDSYLWNVLWVGLGASICLVFGILPLVMGVICWGVYGSFVNYGAVFMSFQWDSLLLEAGFLILVGLPVTLFWKKSDYYAPPKLCIILAYVCCFKLMFASGMVKLLSGDSLWWSAKALEYHYYTQPLPHMLSWFFHQLPVVFHKISCLIMFGIELIMPFLIFINYKARRIAGLSFIGLMSVVMVSGNYCFFNLLTMVLALFCLDDEFFKLKNSSKQIKPSLFNLVRGGVALVLIGVAVVNLSSQLIPGLAKIRRGMQPIAGWHVSHTYGLFASMTRQREEVQILGSNDGVDWKAYSFKYKPNNDKKIPRWTWLHQPRLDWQLWFVALQGYSQRSWTNALITRLFDHSPSVLALFKEVPFETAPKYLVMVKNSYHFSDWKEKQTKGTWWIVGETEQFSPVFKNNNF